MRRLNLALLCAVAAATAPAQTWEKWLAPGLTYRMEVDLQTPRVIHALRFSLGSPVVRAEAELAQQRVYAEDPSQGRETVSSLVRRTGALAGINADFFPYTGDVLGLMVRNGELLSEPEPRRCVFAWGPSDVVFGFGRWSGSVRLPDGQTVPLRGINREAAGGEAVLNFPAAGLARAPQGSVMVVLEAPLEPAPVGAFSGTVLAVRTDVQRLPIDPGTAVLVAGGSASGQLAALRPGDAVACEWRTEGFDWAKVRQAVGGGPWLVRDGRPAIDAAAQGFSGGFASNRHPRTVVGLTREGDVWLVNIDGRQPMSAGATLEEAARALIRLGCVEGINLDGGGSSVLSLFGFAMNRPSDGSERAVSNAVLFYGPRPRPEDGDLRIPLAAIPPVGGSVELRLERSDGSAGPHAEVLWTASGSAWIDQGGTLRALRPGPATVRAFARGRWTERTFEIPAPNAAAASSVRKRIAR
ncbi:MAG: phosphodiester glycosidase family protein [Fimbriimonadales bacterium]|nr:phosphodiester glycosidase family protein [Fimbriimonadales bacterium]